MPDLPTTPQTPASVQPGGGACLSIELAWGRLRRGILRAFFPGYVQTMLAKRLGECATYADQVIDSRDLKYIRNVTALTFRPEDDRSAWRGRLGIARYGWAELIISTLVVALGLVGFGLLSLIHWTFWLLAIPLVLVWLEIVYFFRDPERVIPTEANIMVSPADGVVTHVETVDEPDFGPALRISIFLSIFNVHVNRTPADASVVQVRYFPGQYLDARNPDSARRNEQLWVDLTDAQGRPVRVKQISGAIARRIVCWLKPGDKLTRGERFGMIKFGSRTDLLLPPAAQAAVKVGDVVKGGTTILVRW